MVVQALSYEEIALHDPDHFWELHNGVLVEKPPMTDAHHVVLVRMAGQLFPQIDFDVYDLRINMTRLRLDQDHYYIPDLAIIPVPGRLSLDDRTGNLEVFSNPLPFVSESWSPSTGRYDVLEKLPKYQERGDKEIWLLHPFRKEVQVSRRQPDGT